MASMPRNDETRQRLLEAAGQTFAEVGYEAASIRQITDKAQANLAAVNYYFGDKSQLYQTLLRTITAKTFRVLQEQCTHGTPEERLHNFVRCILTLDSKNEHPWVHLLMAREILELHTDHAAVVVEATRPMHKLAEGIVRDLIGRNPGAARLKLAASLLTSTCVNRIFQQRLDRLMSPEIEGSEVEAIEQVYQFVLMGIVGAGMTKRVFRIHIYNVLLV